MNFNVKPSDSPDSYFHRVFPFLIGTLDRGKSPIYVITINPRDKMQSLGVKELDDKLERCMKFANDVNFIFYKEVSNSDYLRYHYHGILWFNTDTMLEVDKLDIPIVFTTIINKCRRHIGITYYQKVFSIRENYKAYNQKTKREELTNLEKIFKYITKDVNSPRLKKYVEFRNKIYEMIEDIFKDPYDPNAVKYITD